MIQPTRALGVQPLLFRGLQPKFYHCSLGLLPPTPTIFHSSILSPIEPLNKMPFLYFHPIPFIIPQLHLVTRGVNTCGNSPYGNMYTVQYFDNKTQRGQ